MNWPQRIICMTEETVETLYILGEQERIAGKSSLQFAFLNLAHALADIAAELNLEGIVVHTHND